MSSTVGRGTETAQRGIEAPGEKLSLGIAARLSRYLQVLTQARKMGKLTISSQELADYTHVNSTQIRRDLSGFGKFGKRGLGYNVDSLASQIRKLLRTAGQHNIALAAGVGLQLDTACRAFEEAADFTVGIEEEFALLDPLELGLVQRFEELREAAADDAVLSEAITGELISSEIEIRSGRGEDLAAA